MKPDIKLYTKAAIDQVIASRDCDTLIDMVQPLFSVDIDSAKPGDTICYLYPNAPSGVIAKPTFYRIIQLVEINRCTIFGTSRIWDAISLNEPGRNEHHRLLTLDSAYWLRVDDEQRQEAWIILPTSSVEFDRDKAKLVTAEHESEMSVEMELQ